MLSPGNPSAPYLRHNDKAGRLRRVSLTQRAAITAAVAAVTAHDRACVEPLSRFPAPLLPFSQSMILFAVIDRQ